jgi:hypothetical protein
MNSMNKNQVLTKDEVIRKIIELKTVTQTEDVKLKIQKLQQKLDNK